jgi:hypothetical protein
MDEHSHLSLVGDGRSNEATATTPDEIMVLVGWSTSDLSQLCRSSF